MPAPAPETTSRVEIQAEAVRQAFDQHVVLRRVDLVVRHGEIVAIVGASGCGKTVLLKILMGLLRPTGGRVLVAHHGRPDAPLVDLHELDVVEQNRVREAWAVVFQRNALFSGTVRENCALWLQEHTTLDEGAIEARIRQSLLAVALDPDEVLDRDRDDLSGGMAKRVAVARALAVEPQVLFYDEPTTGLDPVNSALLHDLIWATHERSGDGRRRTSVIVTHDRDLLRRVRPRVVMLHQGEVCFDGTYQAFTEADLGPTQEYLREMPVLQARPLQV